MSGINMHAAYKAHKAITWFIIGYTLAVIVMTIMGLGYDYVCMDICTDIMNLPEPIMLSPFSGDPL